MSEKAFDKELGKWSAWHDTGVPLRLGVSSCLLGEEVRFDGGHARNSFMMDVLGNWFEWVPVCPEVGIGMGVPRPTIRLFQNDKDVRLIAPSTREDFTVRMGTYAAKKVKELQKTDLDGYILKKGSPSCGMERIKVYDERGVRRRDAAGLYAAVLIERWPTLPVEEEGRLNDVDIRENFIERVFCRNRWRTLIRRGLTRRRLVAFHTAHKLLLRSHNEAGYRRSGRLVGLAGQIPDGELFTLYEAELYRVMRTRATKRRHVNVLEHALGYMKKLLPSREKREILAAIGDYGAGLIPLIVPLTLLRFNIHRYEIDYLAGQIYFNPHPKELMLRNHV
ncbi:MAG: DUF1722 domain-containing protein [Candidatus Latescibacterota bacterium]|nr:MAG: DUF1722 domain-containing protein [Candidatus Latescibacterota bacterium]